MGTAITNKYPLWEIGEDESVSETIKHIEDLALLTEDWDGFDALAISPVAIAAAKDCLIPISQEVRQRLIGWKNPDVSPTPQGGVYLHWDGSPLQFSVMFSHDTSDATLLVGTGIGRAKRLNPAPQTLPAMVADLLAQQAGAEASHQNGG